MGGYRKMKKLYELYKSPKVRKDTPEYIANNPPLYIPDEHRAHWKELVLRSKHDSYGGAVAHFKHSLALHKGLELGQSEVKQIAKKPPKEHTISRNHSGLLKAFRDSVHAG